MPASDDSALSAANLSDHLRQLEELLFQPAVRRDRNALLAHLDPNFREFGSSGRTFTLDQIVADLSAESPRTISLSEFRCQPLAPHAALVTYRSTRTQPGTPTVHALRSSLWIYRESRWTMLFHHGTLTHPTAASEAPPSSPHPAV